MTAAVKLTVNQKTHTLATDARRSLLEVLREDLQLTGTKYGCGESQCGACTVLIGGVPTRACVTPVGTVQGAEVLTIEGVSDGRTLHPVQEAFLQENAFQCGYCSPGMIMELIGLLDRKPALSREEIAERMEGHLCRCCGYINIQRAIERAIEQRA